MSSAPAGVDLAPLPDGVRLILSVAPGQALSGGFTKDWIRPVTGGGKS
jgi:general secretion pathway protein J